MRKYLLLTALLAVFATAVWAAQPQGGTRVDPLPGPTLERSSVPTAQSPTATQGGGKIEKPSLSVLNVLWDQPASASDSNAYANQDFGAAYNIYDIFIADDFVNSAPWSLQGIYVPGGGWNGFSTMTCATALHWQVYADAAGVPAGSPYGGAAPVWSLSLPPSDPQIGYSSGAWGPGNVMLTLNTPAILPPGHWWILFYAEMNFSPCGQVGRTVADTANGFGAQVINPLGGFGYPTSWGSAQAAWGLAGQDFSFTLYGNVAFDVNFLDDLGRSQACLSRATGYFTWNILSGPYAGYSVTGTAMARNGGTLFYVSTPGYYFYCSYDPIRKKATGYFYDYTSHIYSSLSDANTANNPPGCDAVPPPV